MFKPNSGLYLSRVCLKGGLLVFNVHQSLIVHGQYPEFRPIQLNSSYVLMVVHVQNNVKLGPFKIGVYPIRQIPFRLTKCVYVPPNSHVSRDRKSFVEHNNWK